MIKAFCIGMFKTGTTSIGKAFEILGYKTLHGPWWPKGIMINDPFYKRPNFWPLYYKNIKKIILRYDAFQDYPWMFLYKEIREWYPTSKIILTLRDPDQLAISDIEMLKRLNIPEKNIPNKDKFINRYILHRKKVLEFFEGDKDFLKFNTFKGDEWSKICDFLNKDIPNTDFPHLNKSQ